MLAPAFELERVTTGPSGGNQDTYTELVLSSADGERAVFATYEALTPDDLHSVFDFYERDGSMQMAADPLRRVRVGVSREPVRGVRRCAADRLRRQRSLDG